MTKAEIRKSYLLKRAALSEGDCFLLNRVLYDYFFTAVDLSFIKVIHTYLPITGKKEPDTWQIIDRIRREFPHIQISVPKINQKTGALESFNFEGLHQIQENAWGIPEPIQGVPTVPEKIDLVIVPLLTADKQGHRVGYGKGYYDRFLRSCRPDCKKAGLSFFAIEDDFDFTEDHDQKLTSIITPSGFFSFH